MIRVGTPAATTMMTTRSLPLVIGLAIGCTALLAQAPSPQPLPSLPTGPARFDVVSIKRNTSNASMVSGRTTPDQSATLTNTSMSSVVRSALPREVREMMGMPDWASRDRYDVIAKAPPGMKAPQRPELFWNLAVERMKLAGHIELQEREGHALVVARSDGRLGPSIKPSTLDCTRPGAFATTISSGGGTPEDSVVREMMSRCGVQIAGNTMATGAGTLDQVASMLNSFAFLGSGSTGYITNRTGLPGMYALSMAFSPPAVTPTATPDPAEPPSLFTAVQEQLGLRLRPEKIMVPVFVVDHLERPTED